MIDTLPEQATAMIEWSWNDIEPFYAELESRSIDGATAPAFLADWTALYERVHEIQQRLLVATTQNTADERAERLHRRFLDEIYPQVERAEQALREKLLSAKVEPPSFDVQLRAMRVESSLYREANLPLLVQEQKLEEEYNKIIGAQTAEWEGQEVSLPRLYPLLQETDRTKRERAWRTMAQRRLQDREAINTLWKSFVKLRLEMASNAGFADYRSFRWQQLSRLDYTPTDASRFTTAVEEVAVPACARLMERRREQLGIDTLRPWDTEVDPRRRAPLRPFQETAQLEETTRDMLGNLDPQLAAYFDTMASENLLDLENRKNKAPGGYCTTFAAAHHPFIFMNAVGMHQDVLTLVHECGHAFHSFERSHLPYFQQRQVGLEFAEVASMSMEFLIGPYLTQENGGFYASVEARRAVIEHLQRSIGLWVQIAVVDTFQSWIYDHPDIASEPEALDEKWMELRRRFLPALDFSGLEDLLRSSWHNILHIHVVPFYFLEYGLAQLGAAQVWANALADREGALRQYRNALSLGSTVSLPALYEAAGVKLAFDADTLRQAVHLMESKILELEAEA